MLRRQYSVVNCLQSDFYKSLILAINHYGDFDKKLLFDIDSNRVVVAVKDYGLEKGVARLVFDNQLNASFRVKGPMGRGLGLNSESKGTYVAFAGGTGMFVFVDLLARIALGLLGVIPKEQRLNQDFKLKLFVSFASREAGVAIELMESLLKFCV